jgi:hypothetical protein
MLTGKELVGFEFVAIIAGHWRCMRDNTWDESKRMLEDEQVISRDDILKEMVCI